MAWTAANPVSIGNATKKSDYDKLWDNCDFFKLAHNITSGQHNMPQLLDNLSFTATVGSKALTVALKGADGNAPSATNVVTIAFRSPTLTSGTPLFRTVTGALSVVLSSGSTLGFTAALAGRIYIWAIDNAGTVELALSRTADIYPESGVISTTAEGGAGAADSATVMYSTTARSNVACRCIGFIDITTGATAGEWDNAPTKLQLMGKGVKRTGDIVQVVGYSTGASATGATAIPEDDTIPQKTEGDEYMTQAITPISAVNKLLIRVGVNGGLANTYHLITALFQDDVAGALAAICQKVAAIGGLNCSFEHYMTAGTVSATTFKVRIGPSVTTTFTFNGTSGAREFGGVSKSSITIFEIMA